MSEKSGSGDDDIDLKIIKLVKENNILWEKSNVQFYNTTKKTGIWTTLGAEVGMTKGKKY